MQYTFLRIGVFFVFCFFIVIKSYSQDQELKLKKLKNDIKSSETYSIKIARLLELSKYYYLQNTNLDSMVSIAIKASKLSEKNNFLAEASESFGAMGIAYLLKQNNNEAFLNITKSYDYAKKTKKSELIFLALMRLSGYHEKTNNLPKAVELAIEGLKLAEKSKDSSLMANAYYRLSVTYSKQDNEDKVKAYLDKANKILKQENHKVTASIASGIYAYTVDYYNRLSFKNPKNKYAKDSLLYYVDKGISYGKSINRASLISSLLGIKGKVYFNNKKFSEAKEFYSEALSYRGKIDKISLLNLYNKCLILI